MSTRELPSLDARGIFDKLFHKKLDKDTQKRVDNATDLGSCQFYNIYSDLQKAHEHAAKYVLVKGTIANSSKENKDVKKAYKTLVDKFKKMAKDAGKEVAKHEKELKKHGVTDAAKKCASHHSHHTALHRLATHSTLSHSEHHES